MLALAAMTGCGRPTASTTALDSLAEEFVYGTLALSPASATQAGYHSHKGVSLDDALDDFSSKGIAAQRQFYVDFRARLDQWNNSRLTAEERADFQILSDQIALGLLELDGIQNYRHNP